MCLVVVARDVDPNYPLIVVANRDEFYARGTQPLHHWGPDHPGPPVLAGRDLDGGGTWCGVARGGRFAAVTNIRDSQDLTRPGARSRGELPLRALASPSSPRAVAEELSPAGGDAPSRPGLAGEGSDLDDYASVNLLVGDPEELWWLSNRDGRSPTRVDSGVHGLSNAALDTPWPKLRGAVQGVTRVLSRGLDHDNPDWAEPLTTVLSDTRRAAPWSLPRTGVALWKEWALSARFVRMPGYGTRATTVTRIDRQGRADVVERTTLRGRALGTVSASV